MEALRFQRNQSPFVPSMYEVQRYNCHKYGHVVANCRRRVYRSQQQSLQQYQQPRILGNMYNHSFYSYFYSCNSFVNKEINCRINRGGEAHFMQVLNLAWAEEDLILLSMWSVIHAIILAIWQVIVCCPIIQDIIDKSS